MKIARNLYVIHLKSWIVLFVFLGSLNLSKAQTYYHVPVVNLTGYNKDVIASGKYTVSDKGSTEPYYTLNPNTESAYDYTNGAYGGYILYSTDYSLSSATAPTGGLPSNGLITSNWNSDAHTYQLQSYSGSNALWLYHSGATGTLTFPTAQAYQDLYIMTIGGDGGGSVNITITYTDNTTSTTSLTGADWSSGTSNSTSTLGVISGYSALVRASNISGETGNIKSGVTNQTVKFYESKISPTNTKNIKSILFTNMNAGEMNILAVTGTPTYTVSGTVFSDYSKDNVDNGIGSNVGAQYVVGTLGGIVKGVAAIGSDGKYSFTGVPALAGSSAYVLYLSTTLPTVGDSFLASSLASGWYDSTYVGTSGVGTSIKAIRYANLNASNLASITNINFGIHKAPTSDTKSYTMPYGINTGTVKTMTSDVATGSTTSDLAQLTGVTIYPAAGTILNGNASNSKLVITSLPTNGQLTYNGSAITTANYTISNYDKTKLNFVFTGSGYTSTTFSYNIWDILGFASTSNATYKITLPYPLPVTYTKELAATLSSKTVNLTWSTTTEINNKYFEIQRSLDGLNWNTIGMVPSYFQNGTGNGHPYSYPDENPFGGLNYYRLKQVDLDGKFQISPVAVASTPLSLETIKLYPNPVVSAVNVSGLPSNASTIVIYAMDGKLLVQKGVTGTSFSVGLDNLPSGIYSLTIKDRNGSRIKSIVFAKK